MMNFKIIVIINNDISLHIDMIGISNVSNSCTVKNSNSINYQMRKYYQIYHKV